MFHRILHKISGMYSILFAIFYFFKFYAISVKHLANCVIISLIKMAKPPPLIPKWSLMDCLHWTYFGFSVPFSDTFSSLFCPECEKNYAKNGCQWKNFWTIFLCFLHVFLFLVQNLAQKMQRICTEFWLEDNFWLLGFCHLIWHRKLTKFVQNFMQEMFFPEIFLAQNFLEKSWTKKVTEKVSEKAKKKEFRPV